MKKVKFIGRNGDMIVMLPGAPVDVKFGDVIDVPDDFNNVNFEDVVEDKPKSSK
jgi:hypothetical protein